MMEYKAWRVTWKNQTFLIFHSSGRGRLSHYIPQLLLDTFPGSGSVNVVDVRAERANEFDRLLELGIEKIKPSQLIDMGTVAAILTKHLLEHA